MDVVPCSGAYQGVHGLSTARSYVREGHTCSAPCSTHDPGSSSGVRVACTKAHCMSVA